jgi:hypothetical protein
MANIPSCATVVVLPTNEVIPITNFCSAIKSIKNMETQSIGIKSLSGTCDVKVSDKLGEITILSLDEGSYRFFSDIASISCEPVEGVEGHYLNCSNKELIELKPKEQGFYEAAEFVFDRTETATPGAVGSGFDWSFGNYYYYYYLCQPTILNKIKKKSLLTACFLFRKKVQKHMNIDHFGLFSWIVHVNNSFWHLEWFLNLFIRFKF